MIKYKYHQKFLEDWQLDWWIEKNKALLWTAGILIPLCFLLSGFAN